MLSTCHLSPTLVYWYRVAVGPSCQAAIMVPDTVGPKLYNWCQVLAYLVFILTGL